MTQDLIYERTHYEACLDVRYGVRVMSMSARLYRRIDFFFGFVSLASGSGALAGGLARMPALSAVAGGLIAAVAIADRMIRPGEKALACELLAARFGDLDAESAALSLPEFDARLRRLQADPTAEFDCLAVIAHNRNLASHGRSDSALPETAWQRFIAFFA